jgi:hypothetical protein
MAFELVANDLVAGTPQFLKPGIISAEHRDDAFAFWSTDLTQFGGNQAGAVLLRILEKMEDLPESVWRYER